MLNKRLAILSILLLFLVNEPVFAQNKAPEIKPEINQQIAAKKLDKRAQILQSYLAQHDSPLRYHSQDFIDAADTFGLDWKLVAAISGVESTFGKATPGGFNAWGWGVYGNQAIYFSSWRDGIFTVSEGLKKNYIDRGLTNPYAINRVYAASPFWGSRVSYFLNDINNFSKLYQQKEANALPDLGFQVAGASGEPKKIAER